MDTTATWQPLSDDNPPGYDKENYHYFIQEQTKKNREKAASFIRQQPLLSQLKLSPESKEYIQTLLLCFTKNCTVAAETKACTMRCLANQLELSIHEAEQEQCTPFFQRIRTNTELYAQQIAHDFSLLPE